MTNLSSAEWCKSSYSSSNGGQCVEVALNLPGVAAVRDSKNPDGPHLAFSPEDWQVFTSQVKVGQHDPS